MSIFKIPQVHRESNFDPFKAKALNQELTDIEIIKKVAGSYYTDREWNSAIKIGDTWLSIPCKFLSIYHPIQKKWDLWDNWAEKDQKFLNQLNIPKVTRDPMEKFIFHSSSYHNNVTTSERVGALTNLVVNNNKPADKTLTLIFECKNISIQNNIRPLFAQFLLSPFLPVHNMDLNMLIQPHDDHPEGFLKYRTAHTDEDGIFRFGSREQVKDNELDRRAELIQAGVESTLVDTIVKQQSGYDEYYRLLAYWKVPFYVQLLDFNFENLEETEGSFRLTLNLSVITPEPAYGGLPEYIINETSTVKHFELQKAMERAKKGDNSLTKKMVKMFNLGVLSGDESLKTVTGSNFSNYNLFDKALRNEVNQKDIVGRLEWASAILCKDKKIINSPYIYRAEITRKYAGIRDLSKPFPLPKDNNSEVIIKWAKNEKDKKLFKLTESISNNPVNETVPYGNMNDLRISLNVNEIAQFNYNKKQNDDEKYEATVKKENIKLMQYNLKNWYADGNINKVANGYDERLRRYAYMFLRSGADIITLQELGKTDAGLQDLCTALNDKNINPNQILWKPVHFANSENIGVGMITRLNILNHKIHRTYDIIADNKEMVNYIVTKVGISEANKIILGTRPLIEVTIEKEPGNRITIFVVHYRSKLEEKNEVIRKVESWVTIKAILELPEDMPYIIVGDFNYGMFEEKSASRPQNAYGLYTNRIERYNDKITHRITDAEKKQKKESEDMLDTSEEFTEVLDFICCFDITIMQALQTEKIESKYQDYYISLVNKYGLSNVNLSKDSNFKRLITYHFLGDKIKTKDGYNPGGLHTFNNLVVENLESGKIDTSKTRSSVIDHILFSYHFFENESYLGIDYKKHSIETGYSDGGKYLNNLKQLSWEYLLEEFSKEDLFNTNIKDLEPYRIYYEPLIKEARKITSIDNLPSQMELAARKFKDGTVDDYWVENTIPNIGNGEAFKGTKYQVTNAKFKLGVNKYVDPTKLWLKDEENLMGDHFPVQVEFTWKYKTLGKFNKNELDIINTKPQYFEGSILKNDPLSSIELFPSVNLYGENFKTFYNLNVINEKRNLLIINYVKQKELGKAALDVAVGIIAPFTPTVDPTVDKIIVTGIYYSIVTESYICILQTSEDIAMFPLVGLTSAISEWLKNWEEIITRDLLINTIIDSLKVAKIIADGGSIDETRNPPIPMGLLGGGNGNPTRPKDVELYFISENFPSHKECVRKLDKIDEDQSNTPNFPKIEKTFFLDYFKFNDDYYKGVAPLDPSELSLNISHCQPFRNYYLPLLAEFRDALIDFPWKYNFDIDIFEPFIIDFSGHMEVDQRLVFSRKRIKKSGRSLLGIIETAVEILAKMVEGREDNTDSTDAYRRRYFGEIGELLIYNNYSIRVQNIIKAYISTNTPDKIREIIKLNTNKDWNNLLMIETLIYIGVQMDRVLLLLDKNLADGGKISEVLSKPPLFKINYIGLSKETFEHEMDYLAFSAFNTTIPKLKNEREKVERYLNLNYEMSKNKRYARENTDSFDYSNGNPLKIGELVTLFKNVKEKILDKVFELSREDAPSSDGNFVLETI